MAQMMNDNVRFNDPYTITVNVFYLVNGAVVKISNPQLGATNTEIIEAFQALSPDKLKRIKEEVNELNDQLLQLPSGISERRNVIEAWRRIITSKMYMMSEIFDCNIGVMISPHNPEDHHIEVALATTGMFIGKVIFQ
ncbi:hypothetical protein BJV82DRAFT_625819 [Fennellomyces sp. T-0311]|nr:hypothetical protein BJV82DRAFT_625819 [Fennellomyces sp. T-0311]